MAELNSWNIAAASNNDSPPDGWPENMQYSAVNNTGRENMAVIARWLQDNNGTLTSAGTADAQTLTPNGTYSAYAAGLTFAFVPGAANTGACTLNVSSIGAADIKMPDGSDPPAGALDTDSVVTVVHDGTHFILTAGAAAQSFNALTLVDLTVTSTATFSGATIADLGTVTTADINGGTADGVVIGGSTPAAATFTNLDATGTIDFFGATVTDLGTVTTMDLNGGTIDDASIGATTPSSGAFTSLDASGTIDFSGATISDAGTVTTIDINGGTADAFVIGGATPASGTFTQVVATLGATIANLTGTGTITFTGATVNDLGTVATMDLNGGTIDGAAIGGTTPAAGEFTTLAASGDFNVDTDTFFVDVSLERVGINENIPQTTLHMVDSIPFLRVESTTVAAGYTGGLQFFGSDGSAGGVTFSSGAMTVETDTAKSLTLGTNSTAAITIDTSQNVGIGTSSPSAKLEISGANESFRITDTNGTGSNHRLLSSGTNGQNLSIAANVGGTAGGVMVLSTGNTEAIRIDSSQNVGIGTTSPDGTLHVHSGSAGTAAASGFIDDLVVENNATGGITILTPNSVSGILAFGDPDDVDVGKFEYVHADDSLRTTVAGSEAMRIDSSQNVVIGATTATYDLELNRSSGDAQFGVVSGAATATLQATAGGSVLAGSITSAPFLLVQNNTERARVSTGGDLLVAQTGASLAVVGHGFQTTGRAFHVRDGGAPLYVNRLTNDGTLVELAQGTTVEGTISVSGTTVSYNGAHLSRWSQLPQGGREEVLRGSVLTNLDAMCEWADEANEQLNRMEVSSIPGDPNVSGVFQGWDDDDEHDDFYCAMTGDFVIRIAAGVTVSRGDLLESAGDGTARPQGDDLVRSRTVAKVTSTSVSETYPDGSYLVPCVLMAC